MDADRLEHLSGCGKCVERLRLVEPELGFRMCRLDEAVRLRFDAGRQAKQNALDPRGVCALDFLRCIEDDERFGLRGGCELAVRLVVAVEDDSLAGEAGASCELELAEGR